MKKVIRLTENDLVRVVKQVINEQNIMNVSSDSDYYKERKTEISLPQDDLSVLISVASRFCRDKIGNKLGLMSKTEIEDGKGVDDCYNVESLKRKYYR
jgi:hypothetical protein